MFSPEKHGFLKLDFIFPGGVQVYEHIQSDIDQTRYDTMRLNTYLSQDGDFVTVWWGLIDAVLTGMTLEDAVEPSFSFQDHYEENLFRGYITDNEAGAVILKALRFEHRTPNLLSLTADGKLECHALVPEERSDGPKTEKHLGAWLLKNMSTVDDLELPGRTDSERQSPLSE